MSTHANMVKMTVSSVSATPSTGKGDITLNAASTGFQSFADAYGANATVDILITKGAEWEVARNCTYTHSGTTLTRGTWEDSSNGTGAIVADDTAVVSVVATAAFGNNAALNHVTGGDADTTMAVGNMYVTDMSAWATADRTYTLPAAAAVGDRIGIMVTSGNASYELIIKPNTSDTINGGSAAAEWSRLFITGEVVILRCVTADSAWVVEYDGRIPCNTVMEAASQQTGITNSSWVTITKGASGSWATPVNVGACADAANHAVITRRAGNYVLSAGVAIEALVDAKSILIGFRKNATGSPKRCGRLDTGYNVSTLQIVGSVAVAAAAGDSYDAQVLHLDATTTRNTEYIAGESMSTIRLVEVL